MQPDATLNVDFQATKTNISVSVRDTWKERNPLANVTVLGVGEEPDAGRVMFSEVKIEKKNVAYNATSKVLVVGGLQDVTRDGAFDKNWVLKWA